MANEIGSNHETHQTKTAGTDAGFWGLHRLVICFFTAMLICTVVYGIVAYIHYRSFVCSQERLVQLYQDNIEKAGDGRQLPANAYLQRYAKEQGTFQQEVKSMLDLEFNRIQHEFESLEIWAGVLTVIFLIFSFYSLFKTEQLEQQGKAALKEVINTQIKGDKLLEKLEKDKVDKINSIDLSFDSWKRIKEVSIKKLLSKKSKEYQNELAETYKGDFNQKVSDYFKEFDTRANETIAKSERIIAEELQKVLDSWNNKFEKDRENFQKQQKELFDNITFASDDDINQLFEEEPEYEEAGNHPDGEKSSEEGNTNGEES